MVNFIGEPQNCDVSMDITDMLEYNVTVTDSHFIYGSRNESLYLPGELFCFYNFFVFRSRNIVYSLFCGFAFTMTTKMTISIYNHLFIYHMFI